MTDTINPFPQHRAGRRKGKPTVAEIVHTCVMAGRSADSIFAMVREAHPDKPVDVAKAEIVGAIQAGVEKEVGAENLGKVGAAVASELDRVEMEATRPTVPVYWVVDRIVRQTLDAVETRRSNEAPELQSLIKAAADVINRHPAHLNIVSWLAVQGLENMFGSAAIERGIDYAVGFGSPEVEATEEDLNYMPPED